MARGHGSGDVGLCVGGGGRSYANDDVSKLLWMLRVAAAAFDGTRPVAGWAGPAPNVSAGEYVVDDNLRVDKKAPPALSESLLYKLTYAGVGGLVSEYGRPAGYDRVRKVPPRAWPGPWRRVGVCVI
jgi:dolichyl-diphosphooligosaccharide---protein glycosyltransferase